MARVLHPEIEGLEDAEVKIADRWTVRHARIRNDILMRFDNADEIKLIAEEKNIIMALSLADEFKAIPGCDPDIDPFDWSFDDVPLELEAWLRDSVLRDFNQTYVIPKK